MKGGLKILSNTNRPKITYFALQPGSDRAMFARWEWNKAHTKEYKMHWEYHANGKWWVGNESTTTNKSTDSYSAPSSADTVRLRVAPVSETHKVNGSDVDYYKGEWSTWAIYYFSKNPPKTPSTPTVKIKNYKLTAEVDGLENANAAKVQFEIVANDTIKSYGLAKINTGHASFSCSILFGRKYKVRCRTYRDKLYSDWSSYSSNIATVPATPLKLTCAANSETSVILRWDAVATATKYDIEYATDLKYFDESDKTSTISAIEGTHYIKTGLESGYRYYFRIRAANDTGESGWSAIVSVAIGEKPAAPTTWASNTTIKIGDPLTLYWVHNSMDNSSQSFAEIEMIVNGKTTIYKVENTNGGTILPIKPEDEETDKTHHYDIDTSQYTENTKILWRVRTAGVTKVPSEWSIQRTIDIYAPPVLTLLIQMGNGYPLSVGQLTHFPILISAVAGPENQKPIGYHVSIISNDYYETVDEIGNKKIVSVGDEVYSKYFDIQYQLNLQLSANNIDLNNNASYTVVCNVTMDTGLTAEESAEFTVAWTDEEYQPNAEIGIDEDTLSAYIKPYCYDENEKPASYVTLSVYRREYDGNFTEIATDIENGKDIFVTDPHPALDLARYRIVATSTVTGAVSYYDVPGYPVGEKAAVIQWDDAWSNFDNAENAILAEPAWSGSMLKLPYNIDVSDSNSSDVELVNYIGRSHPVSYYGTQLGVTSSWNMEVPKDDKETLYALRRLAIWLGNVYVREPSGSGYWASIKVSFSQKHCDLTIPVTMEITRVEGGM